MPKKKTRKHKTDEEDNNGDQKVHYGAYMCGKVSKRKTVSRVIRKAKKVSARRKTKFTR
jgi:hypothetical protein